MSHLRLQICIATLTALACLLALAGVIPAVFPYDDAWIVARNAALLASGQPDTAYGVSPFVGSSSTLHLLLVAALAKLAAPGAAPGAALMAAAMVCIGIFASAVAFAVYRLVPPGQRLLAGLLFFAIANVPLNLANGLDTTLAMATALWLLALLQNGKVAAALALAVLAALAVHVRTELAALAGPVLLCALYDQRRARLWGVWLPLLMVLVCVAVSAAFGLWYHAASGQWLPNTLQAKMAYYGQTCPQPWARTQHVLISLALLLAVALPASLFALLARRERITGLVVLFSAAFITAYALYLPMGLSVGHSTRYVCLLVVVWVYAFVHLLALHPALLASRLKHAALVGCVLSAAFLIPTAPVQYGQNNAMLRDVAGWARDNIPSGSRILLHDAGYFAYATDGKGFVLTDGIGLKTDWVVPYHQRITQPSCGAMRAQAIAEIARASQPQWAVFSDYTSPKDFWAGLEQAGYRLEQRYRSNHIYVFQLYPTNP